MKIGSVKFFKRLIVAGFAVIVLAPVVLAVVFGVLYAGQRARAEQLEALNWALTHDTALPEGVDLPADLDIPVLPGVPAPAAAVSPAPEPSFAYQALYPQLKVNRPQTVATEESICYLTFDDGPSANTALILDTLERYGIKATFFVTGQASENNRDMLRRASEAGHTVAVHSYSHEYGAIYASPEAYLEDFARMHALVEDITGTTPGVFRFPGGSINGYNQQVYTPIIAEMTRRGFVFFDWNVAAGDAVAGGLGSDTITANVLNGAAGRQRAVVLMHDRLDNATTAVALPGIIEGLTQQGFAFAPLTASVEPVTYFYPD